MFLIKIIAKYSKYFRKKCKTMRVWPMQSVSMLKRMLSIHNIVLTCEEIKLSKLNSRVLKTYMMHLKIV